MDGKIRLVLHIEHIYRVRVSKFLPCPIHPSGILAAARWYDFVVAPIFPIAKHEALVQPPASKHCPW